LCPPDVRIGASCAAPFVPIRTRVTRRMALMDPMAAVLIGPGIHGQAGIRRPIASQARRGLRATSRGNSSGLLGMGRRWSCARKKRSGTRVAPRSGYGSCTGRAPMLVIESLELWREISSSASRHPALGRIEGDNRTGTDMRLSISRRIIVSDGGRLWANPNTGRGCDLSLHAADARPTKAGFS
jgi:hypothetical protein